MKLLGAWVEFPLPSGRSCLAHVVREKGTRLFAYFYDGDQERLERPSADDALCAGEVEYLGIRTGTWEVGERTIVDVAEWPAIGKTHPLLPQHGDTVTAYGMSVDLDVKLFAFSIDFEDVRFLQTGSMGHVFAEQRMDQLLGDGWPTLGSHPFWSTTRELQRTHARAGSLATAAPPAPSLCGVRIEIPSTWDGDLDLLACKLRRAIRRRGKFDGWMQGPDTTIIYLYGPDWQTLLQRVTTVVRSQHLPPTTSITATDADGTTIGQTPNDRHT